MNSTANLLKQVRIQRHGKDVCEKLEAATVGIAGLGGLGSHIAMSLARMGVGNLVLADFDYVDISNIQRQNYSLSHLNMPKTEAISEQLLAVHPTIKLDSHIYMVDEKNATEIFSNCDVVCEAFDDPSAKAMIVQVLLSECPNLKIVAASGMAGYGSGNSIHTRKAMNRLYLCGDEESELHIDGQLFAARVALCANQQALMTLRLLLGETTP